ncbi:hypothetical protein TX36_24205 [Salmonella enterica]|nr:hypothetical protein [Salmonella enterica]EBI0515666.1 hypothetical protein [Salmonella enterica subsp. enterica serovar Brunei]EDT2974242.1 hypothetical protein [Salmonella enterica subsp. enterica]EGZ3992300.1 hypothetical protein [Salmonella enterica subsp. enterica serovar Giza]EAX3122605.1 hypothetical protein [Salmonella enterica]
MGNTSIRLEEFKRGDNGIEDYSKYTVISHASQEHSTIVDWPIDLKYRPMTRLNQVSMNIHSDLHETKEEAMEQLGRWLVRLGEALQEHKFK